MTTRRKPARWNTARTFSLVRLKKLFRRRGLRYKLVGGFSFYNRAEVKDALAYVRLAVHPDDDVALLRVLNVPPRGIGKTTLDALRETARVDGSSLWTAIEKFVAGAAGGRAVTPLRAFQEFIAHLQETFLQKEPAAFLRSVLDETGYMEMLKDRNTPDDVARIENLEELARGVEESMDAGETFTDFLDAAALVSDGDSFEGQSGVTLITLHSTKGLEFDHVFLTGLEEGICPHSRSLKEDKGIEEERRLCYVGMTRARKSLTVSRAVYRRVFGNERQMRDSLPSRFLAEIPSELVETALGSLSDFGQRDDMSPIQSTRIRRKNFCGGYAAGRTRRCPCTGVQALAASLTGRRSSADRMRIPCWEEKSATRRMGPGRWSVSKATMTTAGCA